jgi:hypothetical protein
MSMVHMPAHHVIKVIAVRNAFVSAFRAVGVLAFVGSTLVFGGAGVGIGSANRNRVFIDVAAMEVMHVPVMKVVRMPLVAYSHVPTGRTMFVTVFGVL